ncbi:hypothetical protein GC163_14465 [bacterium]|nr:hypothetical protein [bacterium]
MLLRHRFTLALLVGISACAETAFACPMCKNAVETDSPQPRAYMISILFMMGMITAVVSAVGILMWRIDRAEKQALQDSGYGHVLQNAVNAPRPAAEGSV